MRINLDQKQHQHKTHDKSTARIKSVAWFLFVMLAMTLSGCGNKGDLYLPEKDDGNKQESIE